MRSKLWNPGSNDLDGLLFEGSPAFLHQLDNLVIRPRRWWRETLLPIIYLVCEPTVGNPLDGLADRLRQSRGILHSRINGNETPREDNGQPSANPIRRLLDGVVADLSQHSGRRRPLKFPHYSLAVWLASLMNHMKSNPPDQDRRVDDALQEFIKERFRLQNRTTSAEVSVINEIPWWVRIPLLLLPPLGIRLMRILWRPPQWVAKSQIASDHSAGSFRGLAQKFMEQGSGEHQHNIQQDEIDRLLVHAFMEDLRRGYRRTTLFGVGRRRTTYPVLLIDNIGSTAIGLRLLDLISASRTSYLRRNMAGPGRQPGKRAYFHPLLIIAQGDSSALDGIRPSNYRPEAHDSYSVADIKFYYSQWYRALTDSDRTWFVPLKVPSKHPRPGLRAELTEIRLPTASPPVMTFVVPALLVATASFTTYSTYYTHCGTWYWEPQLQRQVLATERDQCVGLGPSGHRFFEGVSDIDGMDPELAYELDEIETQIYKTNEDAVKNPRHLTVVYLSELSSRDVADYRTELERLRGIAVAQRGSMADRPVQVLLANGGGEMDYGRAAAEAIAKEASEDATLVAVVGLGISRTGTRDAIMRLADARIPTIGTSISATDLATNTSLYYHQVGPTNQREAEVGSFYATNQLGVKNATIYYSNDDDDLYSNDLRDQMKRAFGALEVKVREQSYRIDPDDGDGGDISLIGQDACDVGSNGVIFYAGRSEQLPVFLKGMQDSCEGDYPNFLGGDDVGRFVLDGGLKNFPGLIVDYLLQASSLAWRSDCRGAINSVGFFVDYQELFGEEACANTQSGGSLLAHDTLLVFIRGVQNTEREMPSPDAVLGGIKDISSQGNGPLQGTSGEIDYPRTGDQAIPKDKAILVLRGQAFVKPQRVLLCGEHDTAEPPPAPHDKCPMTSGRERTR